MIGGARHSITRRLVIVLTLGVIVFWSLAAIGASYVFNEELQETFDLALRETAQRLLPLAIDDLHHGPAGPRTLGALPIEHVAYLTYQVTDASGQVLLDASKGFGGDDNIFADAPASGFSTVDDNRFYTVTDPATGVRLTVAELTAHRREAIADSIKTLFWPLLILIPLSAVVIWLVVVGAMRPVRRLRDQIALRDHTNLSPIEVGGQPVELAPIAEAVANLISRLKTAMEAERAFAANSAHELRTPIAGALAQTQRLLVELESGPAHQRAGEIEGALKRLSHLSEKLLQLSRVDAGIAMGKTQVDLVPILDLVVRDFKAELGDPVRLAYQRQDNAELIAAMDVDAFAIVIRNLVDNALKHGVAGGQVEVGIDDRRSVFVRNHGPVVPPVEIDGLKRRFSRGQTGASGSGLGLSIVEAIAAQSGAAFHLVSPVPGWTDGFEARLAFPPNPI